MAIPVPISAKGSDVKKTLNPLHHAVGMYEDAIGEVSISLVAAEFE